LASGVPVIGARAGGLPEVVTDGETGFLRDVGDVEGMAAAGAALLQDAPRWLQMSQAAALDARRRFAEDAIVARYEALYMQTLNAPSRTPSSGTA
jgi:glycosyltransferase involved in cell wall biosynthesis